MILIVDASVALKWFVPEDLSGELSGAEAEAALTDLASGTLTLRPSAPLIPRALAMAHELDHPVYGRKRITWIEEPAER